MRGKESKFLILSLIFVAPCFIFSQEKHEKSKYSENKDVVIDSSFAVAYEFYKEGNYNLAKRVFADILKKDIWGYDYDLYPFLAESFRKLGEIDSARVTYDNALTLLEDLQLFQPKEAKYDSILIQLNEWSSNFPEFPSELLEENGFTPYFDPPMPKNGWKEIQKRLKYPKSVRKIRMEGDVLLQVLISEAGKPIKFKVLESLHPDADNAAMEAVKDVKFTIPKNRGRPSRIWVAIPIKFRMN